MSTDRIEKQILLRAPRERVWRALSDSTEFGAWFGMRFDGPFTPGAARRGVIAATQAQAALGKAPKKYEGTSFEITIEQMEPERLFSFRWHPFAVDPGVDYSAEPTTLIVFTLEEAGEGVLLTVTESGFDGIPLERRSEAFRMNQQGWEMQLQNIARHVSPSQ